MNGETVRRNYVEQLGGLQIPVRMSEPSTYLLAPSPRAFDGHDQQANSDEGSSDGLHVGVLSMDHQVTNRVDEQLGGCMGAPVAPEVKSRGHGQVEKRRRQPGFSCGDMMEIIHSLILWCC